MTNFSVLYEHPTSCAIIESMVYAVDGNNFLIVNECGCFQWVPMNRCKLVGHFEGD